MNTLFAGEGSDVGTCLRFSQSVGGELRSVRHAFEPLRFLTVRPEQKDGCRTLVELEPGGAEVFVGTVVRRPDLRALTVQDDATIFTALRVIDTNKMGIAFVLDINRRVAGVVTDGDIRHAFVRGLNLQDEVRQAMTRTFVHGKADMSRAELVALLPGRTQVMPVVDDEGRLVDFASLGSFGGDQP